jgi:hypothetical protein
MRKTLTALLLALSAGGASAQYIDVIEMLQAPPSGGGVTLDRNTSTLTIEKPGSLPPCRKTSLTRWTARASA